MTAPLSLGLYTVVRGQLATVVTTLEMRQRPETGEAPRPAGVHLRGEQAADPAWYRALFRTVGTPWLWASRLLLDDGALCSVLHNPAVSLWAVEHATGDIGLLELDFRVPQVGEISFFGLAPGWTGAGLGAWMMVEALERAWSRPIYRLWVHTCDLDHPAALGFYRRHGFVPVRREVEILDDPRALGLLPRDAAPQVPML